MWLLLLIGIILLFGFVILFGAPYLPTKAKQKTSALNLLDLQPGQLFLEFGCGDGRVLKAAAAKGWRCVGYELNPILVLVSICVNWRYRHQVKVVWGSFWRADITKADGIFVFLLDSFMERLDKKLTTESSRQLKMASFAFKVPHKKIIKERDGVFLYRYN